MDISPRSTPGYSAECPDRGRARHRAMANGKLSSSEGARFTFVLRELRCCLESEALEAENAARKAPAVLSEVNVSIITVPSGCFVSAERAEQIANGEFLRQVEHETVSLDDYTRNAAAQQAEAQREINAAVNTVVFAEPIEPPAPSPTPEVIEGASPRARSVRH